MHAHTYVFTHTSYLHLRATGTFSRPTTLRLIRNKPGKIHTFNSLSPASQTDGWVSHFPDKEKCIVPSTSAACMYNTFIREQYRFIGISWKAGENLTFRHCKCKIRSQRRLNHRKKMKPRYSVLNADFFRFLCYHFRAVRGWKIQKISTRHLKEGYNFTRNCFQRNTRRINNKVG